MICTTRKVCISSLYMYRCIYTPLIYHFDSRDGHMSPAYALTFCANKWSERIQIIRCPDPKVELHWKSSDSITDNRRCLYAKNAVSKTINEVGMRDMPHASEIRLRGAPATARVNTRASRQRGIRAAQGTSSKIKENPKRKGKGKGCPSRGSDT